jgi:hypothetical protein
VATRTAIDYVWRYPMLARDTQLMIGHTICIILGGSKARSEFVHKECLIFKDLDDHTSYTG